MNWNITENRNEIAKMYFERGGIESLLAEFFATLQESIDFELNEGIEDLEGLVSKWFNSRFQGKKQKYGIAEAMAAANDNKSFNLRTKRWE